MKRSIKLTFLAAMLLAAYTTTHAQNNGGPTMGWSSWNTYYVNISDALI